MMSKLWDWIELILLIVGFIYTMLVLAAGFILLAPVLILFVAAIVAFILISVMLPIFQLSTVMR